MQLFIALQVALCQRPKRRQRNNSGFSILEKNGLQMLIKSKNNYKTGNKMQIINIKVHFRAGRHTSYIMIYSKNNLFHFLTD